MVHSKKKFSVKLKEPVTTVTSQWPTWVIWKTGSILLPLPSYRRLCSHCKYLHRHSNSREAFPRCPSYVTFSLVVLSISGSKM